MELLSPHSTHGPRMPPRSFAEPVESEGAGGSCRGSSGSSCPGRTARPPCDGGHGPGAEARNRCRLKGGLGERPGLAEAVVGRLVEPGVERGRPPACPTDKPAAARPTAFSTVLRPARAAMTCRPRPWDGQRVAPVVPPAVTVQTAGAVREVCHHPSRGPAGAAGGLVPSRPRSSAARRSDERPPARRPPGRQRALAARPVAGSDRDHPRCPRQRPGVAFVALKENICGPEPPRAARGAW